MNETHVRYAEVIGLKTIQLIVDKFAKLLVLFFIFLTLTVFEICGTQKLSFSKNGKTHRPHDRYV